MPAPDTEPMPKAFAAALHKNPPARKVFEKFPPSHRREYLRHLNSLKRPETLERNIDKLVQKLLARAEKPAG